MQVKLLIQRQVYNNDAFYVFGAVPLEENNLKLNKYGNISLVGELGYLTIGQEYDLEIEEDKETKYGMSYKVTSVPFNTDEPLSIEQQRQILLNITTPSQVDYIMRAYPNFVDLIISGREDEIDVKNIYNVKESKKAVYVREIKDKYTIYMLMAKLKSWQLDYTQCKALTIFSTNIDNILAELEKNPYSTLIDICDMSFESADIIILEHYPNLEDSFQRVEYLILSVLERNELDGSTVIDANIMAHFAKEIAPELVSKLKPTAMKSQRIWYDDQTKLMAMMQTHDMEQAIADDIKTRLANSFNNNLDWKQFQKGEDYELTDEQIKILELANESGVSLLLGSGGSGKTFTTNILIKMFDTYNLTYTLIAPTGTSSKVLSRYTDRKATTIHKRILSGEICTDFLIVDEFSFVGLPLAYELLQIVSPYTKIIFIADEYQLISIDKGNVLFDMIKSEVIPYTRLTKIFRYGLGSMATVAEDTRNGKCYVDDDGDYIFEGVQDESYTFEPLGDEPLQQVMDTYAELLENYNREDILILSPFNVGKSGTIAINNAIQDIYNPPQHDSEEITYKHNKVSICLRKGDRVLNTKNWYEAMSEEQYNGNFNPKPINIMNGSFGEITKIEDNHVWVKFDDDVVVYDALHLQHLILGFACSVHKSQGNQALAVISLIPRIHKRNDNDKDFLTRNLMYVANSRAREVLREIGDPYTIRNALKIVQVNERDTMLSQMLKN